MSTIDEIMMSPRFQSGFAFRPRQIARDLNIDARRAQEALRCMADRGLVEYHGDGVYNRLPDKHWLFKVRLNDWRAMREHTA